MRTAVLLISSLLFLSFNTNAQISKETSKKLRDLKGDVEKITIKTEKGELTISGEDAEALYNLIKRPAYFNSPEFELPYNKSPYFQQPIPPVRPYRFEFLDDDDDLIFMDDADIHHGDKDSTKNIKVFVVKDGKDKKTVKVIVNDSLETIEESTLPDDDGQVIIRKDGDKEIIIKKKIKKEDEKK